MPWEHDRIQTGPGNRPTTTHRPKAGKEINMKTGYQIYVKGMNKNGTRSKKFKNAGLINWFWNEHDAIDRMNKLVDTWKDFGFEYKIVKLG